MDPVDREHTHTVVAAIGDVDVAAGAVDADLGARAVAREGVGTGGHGLDRRQRRAFLPIGRDRRIKLVDHVGERAGRMKVDMARAGARARRHAARLDSDATFRVETVGDDDVAALARHEEVLALAVERIVVRADVALFTPVRADRAGHGGERRIRTKAAILGDRQGGDRIGAVVAHDQEAAAGIEREMDHVVPAGRLPVQHRDAAREGIDRVGRRLAAIAMHRVEPRTLPVDREKGRILQSAQRLHMPEGAGARVDAVDVDAVAVALPARRGVAADVSEHQFPPRMTARPGLRSSSLMDRPCSVAMAFTSARPRPLPAVVRLRSRR